MDSKGMNFARVQLEKFGWKEGQGLGRSKNGMHAPLKPKLKFDSAGLGHSRSDEFTYHWWDHAFNKAASSYDVQIMEDGPKIVTKNVPGSVSYKKCKTGNKNDLKYGSFQKVGTLTNGNMVVVNEEPKIQEEKDFSIKFSDEELFAICEGRTAHKGARHGHSCRGKLERIAEQEAKLMASSIFNPQQKTVEFQNEMDRNDGEHTDLHKKKKRRKIDRTEVCTEVDVAAVEMCVDLQQQPKRKKKKKKQEA